jgi:hypothetical protein
MVQKDILPSDHREDKLIWYRSDFDALSLKNAYKFKDSQGQGYFWPKPFGMLIFHPQNP